MAAFNLWDESYHQKGLAVKAFNAWWKQLRYGKYRLGSMDFAKIYWLVKRHPEADIKLKYSVDYFEIRQGSFGEKTTRIFYKNGKDLDVSLRTYFVGAMSKQQKFYLALRSEIRDQVLEFKEQHKHEGCAHCGCASNLEVDHEDDFVELAKIFRYGTHVGVPSGFAGTWVPNQYDDDPETNTPRFMKQDSAIGEGWKKFHRQYAKLQMLCADCHKKKTIKARSGQKTS